MINYRCQIGPTSVVEIKHLPKCSFHSFSANFHHLWISPGFSSKEREILELSTFGTSQIWSDEIRFDRKTKKLASIVIGFEGVRFEGVSEIESVISIHDKGPVTLKFFCGDPSDINIDTERMIVSHDPIEIYLLTPSAQGDIDSWQIAPGLSILSSCGLFVGWHITHVLEHFRGPGRAALNETEMFFRIFNLLLSDEFLDYVHDESTEFCAEIDRLKQEVFLLPKNRQSVYLDGLESLLPTQPSPAV